MKFSVMFWNVENFGKSLEGRSPDPDRFKERVDQVEAHIRNLDPDLIGLSEIRDKVALRNLLMDRLSDYDFAVTDGAQGIELLAGWRKGKFQQVLFTQRREFKAGSNNLRPGSLASVKFDDEFFNFLFLHTDSGTKKRDYENRQEMFEKIWTLREKFDDISGGQSNFVVLGDLNTMGRRKIGTFAKITGQEEIDELADDAGDNGMKMLSKTHDKTWRGSFESNLDHALSSTNLQFERLVNATSSSAQEISVDGWNHLDGQDRDDFADNISDHCSLFCKIK